MNDFFSQPWWGSVGVIIGGVLSIIAIIVAVKQNKKKKVVYEVPYLYPLVDIHKNSKSDFEVRYKGDVIEQVCVAELQIENTGKIPIRKDEFDENIKVEILNCKHIFTVELVEVKPENLIVNIDIVSGSNLICIYPMLINPNDRFKFKIIFEGEKGLIKLSSRIAGLSAIVEKKPAIKLKMEAIMITTGAMLVIVGNLIIDLIIDIDSGLVTPNKLFIVMSLTIIFAGTISFLFGSSKNDKN